MRARTLRLGASAGLVAALLAVPGPVSADPPERFTDEHIVGFDCADPEGFGPVTLPDDSSFAAGVHFSDAGRSDAFIAYWTPSNPPGDEPPAPPSLEGFTASVLLEGLTLSAEVPLAAPPSSPGEQVGTASITATLTLTGQADAFEDRSPHFRVAGVIQHATVAGTAVLTVPGTPGYPVTIGLSVCTGFVIDQSSWTHFPDTSQEEEDDVFLDCAVEAETAIGTLFGLHFDFSSRAESFSGGFLDVFLLPNDPAEPALVGHLEDPPLTIAGVTALWPVTNAATREVLGRADLEAAFTPGATHDRRLIVQDGTIRSDVTELAVTGTLEVTANGEEHSFDLSGCRAWQAHLDFTFHDPAGPKPGGRVPANDAPDGAIALAVGDEFTMKTGGASVGAEASPCLIEDDGFVFEAPFGRSVWFTIEGTGEDITIDPAGSNFDTVVSAWVATDGGFEFVGCVDDDLTDPFFLGTRQGALTIESAAPGVTYYIQVGGFDEGSFFGEPDPEFGRLRLAIH